MKITIRRSDGPPITIEGDHIDIEHGQDVLELRPHGDGGLLVRIEEHAGRLALDLAVFPCGANSVRLKGGLR